MLTCPNPTCGKKLTALERECPRCRTDLSLLVDYTEHLDDGLARADALTRRGELGDAVWAYLEVLDLDPENPEANRQIGQVIKAVRQFDRASRQDWRRLNQEQRRAALRQWAFAWDSEPRVRNWVLLVIVAALVVLGALGIGFAGGYYLGSKQAAPPEEGSTR
jgi:hypothetical protein